MGVIRTRCAKCGFQIYYEQDGPMTFKGDMMQNMICEDCYKVLWEMRNPDLGKKYQLVGKRIVRIMKEQESNG